MENEMDIIMPDIDWTKSTDECEPVDPTSYLDDDIDDNFNKIARVHLDEVQIPDDSKFKAAGTAPPLPGLFPADFDWDAFYKNIAIVMYVIFALIVLIFVGLIIYKIKQRTKALQNDE